MDIKKLEKFIAEKKWPQFRLRQIKKAIYRDAIVDYGLITTLPQAARAELANAVSPLSVKELKVSGAVDGKSYKVCLRLSDDNLVETVIMRMKKEEWTACVSSQVGCALNCAFCATGVNGFRRNLSAEEVTDQVLYWRHWLMENKKGERLTNIVYMGMGEPFLNWENVSLSLKYLTDPDLFGYGDRNISVSTAGIPEGIKKLAKEFPQINLAISLNSADEKIRQAIMPIGKRYSLKNLHTVLEAYLDSTNRKLFMEYVLIAGINDDSAAAAKLVNFVKSFTKSYLLHVNLIPYNPNITSLKPSSEQQIIKFKDLLVENKISVTVRKSLGAEIAAACGQLAARNS